MHELAYIEDSSINYPKMIANCSDMILCHYTNSTRQIQIARIANIDSCFLERAIIPGGSIIFEAPAAAQLEIYSSEAIASMLSDRIWCERLQVCEEPEPKPYASRKLQKTVLTEINLLRRQYSA